MPATLRTETAGREPTVADAGGQAPIVLVQADSESFLLPGAGLRLVSDLAEHPELALVLPVSNEPWIEEARIAPPFAYLTPTMLAEAADFIAASGEPLRAAEAPSSPVYAVRRELLNSLSPAFPLAQVPTEAPARGFRGAIDPRAYLHRYGAMDAQPRVDLALKVPPGAASVLDVGCARGATAPSLRSRGVSRIVGIEPDRDDAAEAARVYDHVVSSRLEEATEKLNERFDAILFGDVLEHLEDPAGALVRVRSLLKPGGVVIASVPNVGHWSIVDDLIRGRFDYVPYSLLSGTHIRLFTRRTLEDLFEASGFRILEIDTVVLPPSPRGAGRLAKLRAFPGASGDLDVAEFLAVARADG